MTSAAAGWRNLVVRAPSVACALVMACAVILCAVGCEKKVSSHPQSGGPQGVRSGAKPAQNIPEPRIVVLSPALAVILRDLGLESTIIGRHAWDLALAKDLPVCGDQAGIDFEALLKAQPTHVVVQWGERALPQRLMDLALEQGWTIVNENPLTLDDISTASRELARTFEAAIAKQGAQEKTVGMLAALEAACAVKDEAGWKGRVVLLAATSPPAALGPTSWHHEILVRMGATPAVLAGGPYQNLDAEDFLKLAPDGIVLIQPRAMDEAAGKTCNVVADFDEADLHKRLGTLAGLSLPARTAGRVALIDGPLALTPSSSIVEFRQRMREILAAWGK